MKGAKLKIFFVMHNFKTMSENNSNMISVGTATPTASVL